MFLFVDETIITETPPLRAAWALRGQQAEVPMTGSRDKRVLFGVLNPKTGALLVEITLACSQVEFQTCLRAVRRKWCGWQIVLFLDRAPWHTPASCRRLARDLGIELRWLPVACPELNPMDDLWRHVKRDVLANETTPDVAASAYRARVYLLSLTPRERLRKAGVLTGRFWLKVARPKNS